MKRLLNTAQKILQNRGPEARAQFLRNHGIKSKYHGGTTSLPDSGSSDGLSTSSVDCIEPTNCDGDIEVNISIDYFPTYIDYHVSLQVRYKYALYISPRGYVDYNGPENPKDGFGLYWDNNQYQITNPGQPASSMLEPTHGSWDNGSWITGKEGTGFRINDKMVCDDSGQTGTVTTKKWSNWDSCGVTLDPQSGHTDSSEVRGEYVYTYNDTNVSIGVGASFPSGISVSASGSSTTKKEDIGTNLSGGSLIVYAYEG